MVPMVSVDDIFDFWCGRMVLNCQLALDVLFVTENHAIIFRFGTQALDIC